MSVVYLADTTVSEESAASIFRVEMCTKLHGVTSKITDLHIHYYCKLKFLKKLLQLDLQFWNTNVYVYIMPVFRFLHQCH